MAEAREHLKAPDCAPIVITLYKPWDYCCCCGTVTTLDQGIPMYMGSVVLPDDDGPWAGFAACRECFRLYEAGKYAELNVRTKEAIR